MRPTVTTLLALLATAALAACAVEDVTFNLEVDGGDAGVDDGPPIDTPPGAVELLVSTASTSVAEAAQTTITVALTAQPTAAVLVNVTSSDDTKLGVTPNALLFGTTDWATPQTVTLSGREDADVADESATVMLAAPAISDQATVDVTVSDNDGLGIVISPATSLDVNEGASADVTVRLSAQPAGDIVVAVGSANTMVATVSPGSLTFGTATWDVPQTVTVAGVNDVNTSNDGTTVGFTGNGLVDVSLPVQVVDDDVLGIEPSTTNLGTLSEGVGSTFTVRLTQQPPAAVTVTVMSGDATVVTAGPATLSFTTVNWNAPQTVTVGAPHDADVGDESTTIALAATGLTTRNVAAAVTDDDEQVIVATPLPFSVSEGASAPLDVRLGFQPAASVTVNVSSLNTSVATVTPATLTFTPANYATTQAVSVSAPQDLDASAGLTTLRLENGAESLQTDVPATVIDDDQLAIETNVVTVTVAEGATAMFQARLSAAPATTVVVNVTSGDTNAATVSPATLMFTPGNWNTYQPVMVTGVGDVDLGDETLTVTLAANGLPAKTVGVTVSDDDVQAILVAAATLDVTEGASGTVGVTLRYMPSGNVSVSVMSASTTVATVAPATLTFTPANYATPQNITVSGAQDADAASGSTTVALTATGVTAAAVAITVTDDESLAIVTDVSSLTVGETATGSFGVRLTAQPAAAVTVTVVSGEPGAATVSTGSLTFSTVNWNTYQNVTVAGIDDPDAGNESVTVTLASTGLSDRTVNVTITDNDVLGIVTTTTAITLGEAGFATFGVHLSAMPAGNVTVNVNSLDTGAATVMAPTTLTFTPVNYATDQTVRINGVADQDLGNESVMINLTSASLTTRTVTAAVTDDDTQEVLVSQATVNVNEGATATFGVTLRYIPSGSVSVAVASASTLIATAAPTPLTFTAANYNVSQQVTVTGVQDANGADNTTTVTASASGATSGTVTVNVNDDEIITILTEQPAVTLAENGTGTLGVRLSVQPGTDIVVTAASGDPGAATVTPMTRTFTAANWNSYQSFTLTGVADGDVANEALTLTLSSPGLGNQTASVSVTDDDPQVLDVDVGSLSVTEGGTATFRVRLGAQPGGAVTVTLGTSDATAATVTASLGFTAGDYNVYKTATVTGVQDVDLGTESVTITASTPTATNRTVAVTVTDEDVQAIVPTTAMVNATEGLVNSTQGFRLAFQPAGTVTVNVVSSNPTVATVSPGTLTFNATTWNTAQPVQITGVEDANTANETATINASASGIPTVMPALTVYDNDAIIPDDTYLYINQWPGGQGVGYLGVRLSAMPPGTVTLTIMSANTAIATAVPTTLTFTTSNYMTAQTLTVSEQIIPSTGVGQTNLIISGPGYAPKTVLVDVDYYNP